MPIFGVIYSKSVSKLEAPPLFISLFKRDELGSKTVKGRIFLRKCDLSKNVQLLYARKLAYSARLISPFFIIASRCLEYFIHIPITALLM